MRLPALACVPILVLLAGCGGSVTQPAPTAAFAFAPAAPLEGQAVTFSDASTGSPTGWTWSFGDGTSSSLQSPTHAYAQAGTYTVTLTAANGAGSATASHAVTVSPGAPVAAFGFSPTAPAAGQAVAFTDASTGAPTGWAWSFGDGTSSTARNPTHVYGTAGTYDVNLAASNAAGTTSLTRSITVAGTGSWRFAVVGDTHVAASATAIPAELAGAMAADQPSLVLVSGDLVAGGLAASAATLKSQLELFRTVMEPLTRAGIPVYPVRGNHENDAAGSATVWGQVFSGAAALPANGPAGEAGLTYAVTCHNALFIGLDEYANLHRVNQAWLDQQLAANTRPHVFVFGHEAAFKVFHADCLDDEATGRNTFWQSLSAAGARLYFCGHDHFFDFARIDGGDAGSELYQCLVGTGGGTLFTQHAYNGANAPYIPTGLFHQETFGYLLVELSGTSAEDLDVSLTWKQRTLDPVTGSYGYVPAWTFGYTAGSHPVTARTYAVVDTGQTTFYGNASVLSSAPSASGDAFYGQDAQFTRNPPAYVLSSDGRTVQDRVTGLTWMRGPNQTLAAPTAADKLDWNGAQSFVAAVNAARYGGFADWRLPSIKELYSLIRFSGTDPSGMTVDPATLTPFIDTSVFNFAYGQASAGERVIDAQYLSSNVYAVSGTMPKYFGVNFADGRIKGYDARMAGGGTKAFFVQLVRGGSYGANDFTLTDGGTTVTDRATGLMWSRDDSGLGMTWQAALAWVQARNAAGWLGHGDWRLPNAKELQSIVDYRHAPDGDGQPALDTAFFHCTAITNEHDQADYPWFWAGTTHAQSNGTCAAAAYVCFGRGLGYMNGAWVDIHGAGCQRSDPKTDTLATAYRRQDNGYYSPLAPQGDAVRVYNFVRLVRDAD